eukprot:ctg_166.g105
MSTVARASAGAADIGELSVGEREARLGTLLLWAPCPADCGHGHDASDADSPAAGPGQHRWKGSATLSAGCPWAGEAGQHVARLSRVLHVVVTLVTVYRVDGRDGLVGAVAFCAGDRGLDLVRWSRDRSRSPKCRAALRWLARHLLRPWPAPAEWQWVPAVRSCGVFGCRSCDARAIGDDEACSQFRLGRVMRSIPSRVDAFLARQEREAALLVERLAKCPPPPGSLLALPVEVLSRALALLDSTTSCSLSHTCRYMQHLGASIAPGLRLQLNEHQVCALQWMLQRERHAPAARDTLGECQRYLWEDPLSSPLGERLFYNWLHDTVDDRQRFYYDARGGLFCDEPHAARVAGARGTSVLPWHQLVRLLPVHEAVCAAFSRRARGRRSAHSGAGAAVGQGTGICGHTAGYSRGPCFGGGAFQRRVPLGVGRVLDADAPTRAAVSQPVLDAANVVQSGKRGARSTELAAIRPPVCGHFGDPAGQFDHALAATDRTARGAACPTALHGVSTPPALRLGDGVPLRHRAVVVASVAAVPCGYHERPVLVESDPLAAHHHRRGAHHRLVVGDQRAASVSGAVGGASLDHDRHADAVASHFGVGAATSAAAADVFASRAVCVHAARILAVCAATGGAAAGGRGPARLATDAAAHDDAFQQGGGRGIQRAGVGRAPQPAVGGLFRRDASRVAATPGQPRLSAGGATQSALGVLRDRAHPPGGRRGGFA